MIATLRALTAVLERRRTLALTGTAVGAAISILVATHVEPKYTAQASILMVAEPVAQAANAPPQTSLKPILSSDLPFLATTATVLSRVARDLGIAPTDRNIDRLAHSIKARVSSAATSPMGQTSAGLLVVAFSAPSAARAIAGANAAGKEITGFYQERATSRFKVLIADLKSQLADRKTTLHAIDLELQGAVAADPFFNPKDSGSGLGDRYQKLISDRDEALTSLQSDKTLARAANARVAEVLPLADREILDKDPTYAALRDHQAKDAAQLSLLKSQFSARYPGLVELQHTVDNENTAVVRRTHELLSLPPRESLTYSTARAEADRSEAAVASDEAEIAALDGSIQESARRLATDTGAAARVASLQIEREAVASSFGTIAGRLAQAVADEAEAASVGSVNMLDRAQFAKAALYTNVKVLVLLSVLATMAFAAAVVYLAEMLDQRMHADLVVENVYGVPVIATLR
jgi:uncharacterized protein involved in exopolysaccharide biosynthesis